MKLLNYTRMPMEDAVYANRLAYSMHLAIREQDGTYTALNHNSGVLFVKATENEDGSLNPKSLKNPWIFSMKEGGYGVFAIRTLADGEDDISDRNAAVFWTSKNLLDYAEQGQLYFPRVNLEEDGEEEQVRGAENALAADDAEPWFLEEVRCVYDEARDVYRLQWRERDGKWYETCSLSGDHFCITATAWVGNIKRIGEDEVIPAGDFAGAEKVIGAVPHNVIEISDELGEYLRKKLMPAEHIGTEMPGRITVSAETNLTEALKGQYAKLSYSDGTVLERRVIWDEESLSKVELSKPGSYQVQGKVYKPHFVFPIATDRADPCVCRWEGKYYYIATNDADGNHTLYMRCADSLEGIADAEEHLILDSSTYEDIGGLLWAPEFHEIDGRLYLFHAATPEPFFCEESHIMELREGGDPLNAKDWSRPKRVVRMDGSDICEAGQEITLDMTEFEWQGDLYAIWSQRQFLPKDLGAWLYIAKLNRKEPWKLASDPVVLSKPEYGWANNHTFVDEGPFALIRGEKLYVTFSSAAVDSTYVVGLLQINAGKDLLNPANWKKTNYPIFTSRSLEGEYGTGHNAYVTDEDGIVWNTYHARPGVNGPRSTGFRRVHFDFEGEPKLDVTEDLDVKEELASVVCEVEVR